MTTKILHECMQNMYNSTLNTIYNHIQSTTGETIPGDITPELQIELDQTLQALAKITFKLIALNMPYNPKIRYFLNTANGEYITTQELEKQWYSFDESERFPHNNFNDFLNACQIYNGGTLIELTL